MQVRFKSFMAMIPYCYKTIFVMAESWAYFEACHHILRSLQKAEVETIPFACHLIHNRPNPVIYPWYMSENIHVQEEVLTNKSHKYDLQWVYSSHLTLQRMVRLCLMNLNSYKR